MKYLALIAFLLCARPGSGQVPAGSGIPPAALSALVDSVMWAGMAEERIPGAAVLIIHRGKAVLSRGYGVADLASRRAVDPRTTLWPFASITKVVTATAVMQLAERGRLDLDSDINRYLKLARVPPGPAITARHLLTHTDALDELPGRQVASREALQPLGEFLRTRLVRIGPPGLITRYGTYGIALAGVLVEDVSGLSFAEYLRREMFTPLGLRHTTIDVPRDDRGAFATPYEADGDTIRPARAEWYHTSPTSSLVSTVEDMGTFMAMHLGAAPPGARPVLTPATIRDMAAQHATVHPAIPGWGYGWQLSDANGRRIVEHGGDIGGFASLLTLLPDEGFGFVIAHHLEGSNLRFALRKAILDRFFPDRRPPRRPLGTRRALDAFAGTYLASNYCRSCPDGAANAQRFRVTADSGGWLELWGDRWREADSLLFVNEDGRRAIGFGRDSAGRIVAISAGSWRVLERAPAGIDPGGSP